MNEDYKSIFVPSLNVNVENYIAEMLINNKISFKIKKGESVAKPNCAFWRKDISSSNPLFKELTKDYVVELTYIKNLLRCFSPKTIIEYIKERGLITFRYLDVEKQKTVIYNLWKAECDGQKALTEQKKKAASVTIDDLTAIINPPKSSVKNELEGLL